MATYKIHPGIGIARLGNSDTEFYLAPETPAGLPQACDAQGNPSYQANGTTPVLVTNFRDAQGRIKRQAARVYDDASPEGRSQSSRPSSSFARSGVLNGFTPPAAT